jgi:hypothetical protein
MNDLLLIPITGKGNPDIQKNPEKFYSLLRQGFRRAKPGYARGFGARDPVYARDYDGRRKLLKKRTISPSMGYFCLI